MSSSSVETGANKARGVVERIAREHGHVGDGILSTISDADARRLVAEALKKKDIKIGSSVVT